MVDAAAMPNSDPHIPVLLQPLLRSCSPISGRWLDGTFGNGGYTRGLLDAGADHVIGVDRDPMVFDMAAEWAGQYGDRLTLHKGQFSNLDTISDAPLDGIALDLGVSSMQIDTPERGFSFQKDGPLDMRMGDDGPSAGDIVNTADEGHLANILYLYGEERASRRIARAIVAARPIETTLRLAEIVAGCLPRAKPGQSHPATRSFQALRIAVNDEYGELYQGLMAAERALAPGGFLAVVTFHSVEDRMVKRFMQHRSGGAANANRYAPASEEMTPAFTLASRKPIGADADELAANPRSRSAMLRVARRTEAPAGEIDPKTLGMPLLKGKN